MSPHSSTGRPVGLAVAFSPPPEAPTLPTPPPPELRRRASRRFKKNAGPGPATALTSISEFLLERSCSCTRSNSCSNGFAASSSSPSSTCACALFRRNRGPGLGMDTGAPKKFISLLSLSAVLEELTCFILKQSWLVLLRRLV